jgi:centrin-1
MAGLLMATRLNDREVESKKAAQIQQYTIKPSQTGRVGKTIRHKDQQDWLRAHGKIPARDLTGEQRAEIRECFNLLDADSSGALDVDELQMAFKVLSIPMTRHAILRLFQAYSGGGDEVDLKAFEKIMAASNAENSDDRNDDDARAKKDKNAVGNVLAGEGGGVSLPFSQVASAFRRKKLLENFMEGGHARQEILDKVETERQTNAANLFRLPSLRDRMNAEPGEKVVSRYSMLDKLQAIDQETWAGTQGLLPSQAIHQALGRNHTWDMAQKRVAAAKAAGTDAAAGEIAQMDMYKMSAEDRQYAQMMAATAARAAEAAAEAAARAEGGGGEEGAAEAAGALPVSGGGSGRRDNGVGGAFGQHVDSPSSIPKLPPLAEEPSLGQVSSTSSRGRKTAGKGNGFVPTARKSKAPPGASRAQVELAKIKKAKHIGEEKRNRREPKRNRRRTETGGDSNGAGWGGGGAGDGESSMVATVARDRISFGQPSSSLAGASSQQMPSML